MSLLVALDQAFPVALAPGIGVTGPELLPLDAGEQYRFAFDMASCIGCHSCEVACAEQNATPAGLNWRRVGEIEGGLFPDTRRAHLSMACNHCLEPACLIGCPTNAYVKLANGVVSHQAEECIGCQYCIWNCPYEVPVFDPARGVVTKCDMCLPRLESGMRPACVDACPTGAITVEKVAVGQWRADHSGADAPGLPPSALTLSTTRVVVPEAMPPGAGPVGGDRVEPADPHWPLVALTLLTQLAVGAVATALALSALAPAVLTPPVLVPAALARAGGAHAMAGVTWAAALAGSLAMVASLRHLGRPGRAWKALRNLRRSWLSREVALFSAFVPAVAAYAAGQLAWGQAAGATRLAGLAAAALGTAGVYASGRLYQVPARPVWNSDRTLVAFFATAAAAGPLLALVLVGRGALGPLAVRLALGLAGIGSLAQLGVAGALQRCLRTRSRGGNHEREWAGTARLLRLSFRRSWWARLALAAVAATACLWGAFGAPLGRPALLATLVVAGGGELIGRWLFFVTVTPMTAGRRFSSAGSR